MKLISKYFVIKYFQLFLFNACDQITGDNNAMRCKWQTIAHWVYDTRQQYHYECTKRCTLTQHTLLKLLTMNLTATTERRNNNNNNKNQTRFQILFKLYFENRLFWTTNLKRVNYQIVFYVFIIYLTWKFWTTKLCF